MMPHDSHRRAYHPDRGQHRNGNRRVLASPARWARTGTVGLDMGILEFIIPSIVALIVALAVSAR